MIIPFVGGAYTGRSTNINAQVCQNLYAIVDQQSSKAVIALQHTPGLTEFCDLGTGEVRGLHVWGDYLYAVMGTGVYKINSSGTATTISGTLANSTGKVWMANNGLELMIVDPPYGYIVTTSDAVALVSDSDFPSAATLTFQDHYFIIVKEDSGEFYISALLDGNDWDALDYATAEGDPDDLKCAISVMGELWLIGARSYEVWYNSGDSTFPFERIAGTYNKIGTIAAGSVAEYMGILAWLDDNRYVRMKNGYTAEKISTPPIDYQISTYTTVTDAIGYIYTQEGHTFYVLQFPTEGKTWVYDFFTGLWHTRASNSTDLRHPINCCVMFNGLPVAGHYSNGILYHYDLGVYTDDGVMQRRIRAAQAIHSDRKNVFHHALQIEFEAGVGLITDHSVLGVGDDPQAMLQWSDDGGHTWSNEHWTDIGPIGEYTCRAIWRKLGKSRDRVYRVIVTDPVKTVIIGASLEAEGGNA